MAYDPSVLNALASEVRKTEAQKTFLRAQERFDVINDIYKLLVSRQGSARAALDSATTALTTATANAPGLTDDFGQFSTMDQALRAERFAGKSAVIDFIKANPNCIIEEAVTAYSQAALATRPVDQQILLQVPQALFGFYASSANVMGVIQDASWASFRAMVYNLPKEMLMGL
jgi:light-regulated signal transduction histidine kinase (bacteriophytochrome)